MLKNKNYYSGIDGVRAFLLIFGPIIHAKILLLHNDKLIHTVAFVSNNSRMECFFLLSGYVSSFATNDYSWLKKRLRIVIVPFISGCMFILPLCAIISPAMLPASRVWPLTVPIALEPLHLWFLLDLALFCVLLYLLNKYRLIDRAISNLGGEWLVCILIMATVVCSTSSVYMLYIFNNNNDLTLIWLSIIFRIPKYLLISLLGSVLFKTNFIKGGQCLAPRVFMHYCFSINCHHRYAVGESAGYYFQGRQKSFHCWSIDRPGYPAARTRHERDERYSPPSTNGRSILHDISVSYARTSNRDHRVPGTRRLCVLNIDHCLRLLVFVLGLPMREAQHGVEISVQRRITSRPA